MQGILAPNQFLVFGTYGLERATPSRLTTGSSPITSALCSAPVGNMDKVSCLQNHGVFRHADAETPGEHSVNFVSRMSVVGEECPGRIDIACDSKPALLQLATHGLLRHDAIFFRAPAFDLHREHHFRLFAFTRAGRIELFPHRIQHAIDELHRFR